MKCIKRGCDRLAIARSNYCEEHKPSLKGFTGRAGVKRRKAHKKTAKKKKK